MGGSFETTTPVSTRDDAFGVSRADRKQSLDALQQLEVDAGTAAPGREADWLAQMRAALDVLEDALDEQARHSGLTDSLLSDIQRDEPRLRNRVIQLRGRFGDLRDSLRQLRSALDTAAPDAVDVADIRRRLERFAAELRYQRAREADLIYEAYTVDLGAGD
jgi:hypothetical protein